MSKLNEALDWEVEKKSDQEIKKLFEEAKDNGDCKQFKGREYIKRFNAARDDLNSYLIPNNPEQAKLEKVELIYYNILGG